MTAPVKLPTISCPRESFASAEFLQSEDHDFSGGISRLDFSSHLSYAKRSDLHEKGIVKVHRVLPSNRLVSASSRRIQFHWGRSGDSGAIVTPFMRVATYATRNFATLGLLELQPPFTGPSIRCMFTSPVKLPAPGRRQTLYVVISLCRVMCF